MNLTTENVSKILDYNLDTGVFTWKARAREWFMRDQDWKRWNTRYAGKMAGYVSKTTTGYPRLLIKVLGKGYLASRLAFVWMGESLPDQVDHADGDSLFNRWDNLKPSTNADNHRNQSMSRANTSGATGVTWHKAAGKWQAKGGLDGKRYHLGYFGELDEATAAVSEFRAASGFSERHGQALSAYQEAGS